MGASRLTKEMKILIRDVRRKFLEKEIVNFTIHVCAITKQKELKVSAYRGNISRWQAPIFNSPPYKYFKTN